MWVFFSLWDFVGIFHWIFDENWWDFRVVGVWGPFFFIYICDESWVVFPCGLCFRVRCVSTWGGCVSEFLCWVWNFFFFFDNGDCVMWNSPVRISFLWHFFFFRRIFVTVWVIVSGC